MTKEAVKKTEIAAYKEKIDAVRINIIVEQISKGLTTEEFMNRYEEELRKDKNFEGSEITREGETIILITKEGYVFKITEEGTNYEGDKETPETPKNPPDLRDSNAKIDYDPDPEEKPWTNSKVTVTVKILDPTLTEYTIKYGITKSDGTPIQDGTIIQDGTNNYALPFEVEDNGTMIDVRLIDSKGNTGGALTGNVTNIDRLSPTVTLSPNGGTYVLPTTNGEVEGSATISTKITAVDQEATSIDGESKIKIAQYAWSQSNTTEPSEDEWRDFDFTKEEPVSKTIASSGKWYLWTKVIDNAGNHAGNQEGEAQVSDAFVVGGANEEVNQITLTPDNSNWTNGWTNKDVEVTVSYGTNLTKNRTLTCEGTLGTDYTIEGTEGTDYTINGTTVTVKTNEIKVIVKTNGKVITAKAKDEAGNEVVVAHNVSNIDKTPPTVELDPNGGEGYILLTNGTATISTAIMAKDDDGDGISRLYMAQYAWSTSNTTEPSTDRWTTIDYNGKIDSKDYVTNSDIDTTGSWYLWTKVIDNAGNYAGGKEGKGQVSAAFKVVEPKIGDKVNYVPDTEQDVYKLRGSESGNGTYSSGVPKTFDTQIDQDIERETLEWRVLKINDKNGQISLIGSPTEAQVNLGGALGYDNGVLLLNKICEALYSGKHQGGGTIIARSVSLEDFEDKMTADGVNKKNAYTNNVKKYGDRKEYTGTLYYPSLFGDEDGAMIDGLMHANEFLTESGSHYTRPITKDYFKIANSRLELDQSYYKVDINPDNFGDYASVLYAESAYWLATRYHSCNAANAGWGLRGAGQSMNASSLYYSTGDAAVRSYKLRPVVTVKASDIQIIH